MPYNSNRGERSNRYKNNGRDRDAKNEKGFKATREFKAKNNEGEARGKARKFEEKSFSSHFENKSNDKREYKQGDKREYKQGDRKEFKHSDKREYKQGDRITSYNVCYTKLLRIAICIQISDSLEVRNWLYPDNAHLLLSTHP